MGSTVIITGGDASERLVGEYNEDGFIKPYLPPLQGKGRYAHGCSFYKNNQGFKVNININYSSQIFISDVVGRRWL